MSPFSIQIQGAGPVGLALALWLRRSGWPADALSLLDAQGHALQPGRTPPPGLASRTLALGLGSLHLLERIVHLRRTAPIRSVEVSMKGYAARTLIEAADHGADQVGAVVRYADLMAVLDEAWFAASALSPSAHEAAMVQVHAEGKIPEDEGVREFRQAALTAELTVHRGVLPSGRAFERFTREGPLAMLPLPEAQRYALVWCAQQDLAQQRAHRPEAVWLAELQEALGPRFGELRLSSAMQVVSLVRRRRSHTLQCAMRHGDAHQVWIGNAAQSLHPVAGQGLNLGLRDAFELAQVLLRTRPDHLASALQTWQRLRQRDASRMVTSTDSLATLFTWQALRPAQSLALGALNAATPLRSALARHLMFGLRNASSAR